MTATELLTVEEAAADLRVTVAWLKRQVSARKVPHTRLGRTAYFTPDQVAQIVAAAEVPTGPAATDTTEGAPLPAPALITLTPRSRAAQRRRTA